MYMTSHLLATVHKVQLLVEDQHICILFSQMSSNFFYTWHIKLSD